MRRSIGLGVVLIGCLLLPAAAVGQDDYVLGPDSQRQPDVPRGTVTQHRFTDSEIFPGTERDYAVYVPAQYDPAQPACVTVFQDGVSRTTEKGQWRVPIVFDNLIHRGEMPVSIGIFINPGVVPPAKDNAQNRYNRSFEYDAVSDRYARFLIEEMLPLVGQDYNLSDDPNDRAICGSSSGAIAAFGAAWQRPDQFRRVYSTIGTFVDLRGGNDFPDMIRKTEPKPLRVFLQDGRNDLNIYGGSWWVANQGMLSALQWAGYDVTYRWGEGGHSGKHGAAILPEAMRWLWRDYPAPIEPAWNDRHELRNFLRPDEDWQEVSRGHRFTEGPAVAPDGTVYFTDVPAGEIWRVDAKGDAERFATDLLGVSGLMFDAQGRLYCSLNRQRRIVRLETDGTRKTIAEGIGCNDLVVLEQGLYCTDPAAQAVWYVPWDGPPVQAASGITGPNGLIVSTDKAFLLVVDAQGRYVWSYRIHEDGSLDAGQPFYYVHAETDRIRTGADGATMARDNWLMVATSLGVQVFDQPGRCHGIIRKPQPGPLSNVVIGGPDMDWLYATSGDKVFRRRLATTGVAPWQAAVKPPKPRL